MILEREKGAGNWRQASWIPRQASWIPEGGSGITIGIEAIVSRSRVYRKWQYH